MNFNPAYIDEQKKYSPEEIKSFEVNCNTFNKKISTALNEPNREVIEDGVFNSEGYLKSKIRILWLMKEPYDTDGGGWHISEIYRKKSYGASWTTWYPIIDASHLILTGQPRYDSSKGMSISNLPVADVLLHIAYVNIQRLPSLTREKTDNKIIQDAFKKYFSFFQIQYELLNPDIIIGANTLNDDVFVHFGLKGNNFLTTASNQSYVVNDKLFIRAKHPAQRRINKVTYVNDIVNTVHEWRTKTNK